MPDSHNHGNNASVAEPVSPNPRAAAGLLMFAQRVARLKAVPRTGWLDRGVPPAQTESVADHSCGVALLAWVLARERQAEGASIDPSRVLALALIHDLAEAEIGDLPPYDPASIPAESDPDARRAFLERRQRRNPARAAAKRAAEDAAMADLAALVPAASGAALGELWEELRRGETTEARFVKQIDRLETFLQSLRYQEADPNLPVDSFRLEVLQEIDDPLLAGVRDAALFRASPPESG